MPLKVVLDTNVLIAAFYKPSRGPSFSKDIYDYVVQYEEAYVSPFILKEFREKCLRKLKFKKAFVSELEALIRKRIHVISPEKNLSEDPSVASLRDPDDKPILALVHQVEADLLLTWDKDLLVLGHYKRTTIKTPKAYLESL